MEKHEELVKVYKTEMFNGSYCDLRKKNIILNTIRVLEIVDSRIKVEVPFDIKVAGENAFRIIPASSCNKFFIGYCYLEMGTKIIIKSNDISSYKQENGDYVFFLDSKGSILNKNS